MSMAAKSTSRTEDGKFRAAAFGENACLEKEFAENRRDDFFKLIWLKNGAGSHKIDLYDHDYNGSVLFILSPSQIHKIEQIKPSDGYFVKFLPSIFRYEKDFFDYVLDTCLFDSVSACPVIGIPDELQPVLEDLFVRVIEEFDRPDIDSENIVSSYLKILITHVHRLKRRKTARQIQLNDPHYSLFREFKIAVEKNYKTEHSVQEYAKFLRTQPRTLNSVARKFGDKTAGEIIQERILLEAQRSLFHETLSVKEIGYELGFDDPAYFTRFFKKHTGVAPLRFKSSLSASDKKPSKSTS